MAIALLFGILLGIFLMSSGIATTEAEIGSIPESLGTIIGLIIPALWYILFECSKWQATPGKRILKLEVTDTDGRQISFGRSFTRYICKIISVFTLGIGFFMAGWTKQKQALHDKMVNTLVVKSVG